MDDREGVRIRIATGDKRYTFIIEANVMLQRHYNDSVPHFIAAQVYTALLSFEEDRSNDRRAEYELKMRLHDFASKHPELIQELQEIGALL